MERTELNRTQPPHIKDAVEFDLKLKPYEYYQLRNGVEVYAVDAGSEDLLQIEWVFSAGNWFEPRNLVAASTNFLLKNGTRTRTAFQLNEHFEYYGAYVNRNCYNETATVSLHCLNKHLRVLLPVIRDMITEATLPEDELAIYKQNMKQRLNVNLKKCDFVAGRLIDAYLYGEDHPYGRYTRFEDFDGITRDELDAFYQDYYRHGRLMLFVAGKLPEGLFPLLDELFGDLDQQTIPLEPIPVQAADERKYRIMNDPASVQGAIRLGAHFPNRHHPDFVKTQVLNNVFGGFFGSRLMSNIREEKGYTYGIYSYLENHRQQSAWIISTEAGRDVCEPAIVEVYKEMQLLRDEPIDEEELLLVRNYMIGSILGDLDGPFHIINRWKTIILNGLEKDYFYKQMNTIKTVSAAELQELANKYLHPEKFYELVVV